MTTTLLILKFFLLSLFTVAIFFIRRECQSLSCWVLRFSAYFLVLIIFTKIFPYSGKPLVPYDSLPVQKESKE